MKGQKIYSILDIKDKFLPPKIQEDQVKLIQSRGEAVSRLAKNRAQ